MVVLFLANGFEEIEALCPLDLLRRAGVEVRTVGIGGLDICGAHGITVRADMTDASWLECLPSSTLSMVILPGGMPGASHLDASDIVAATLARAQAQNAYMAAICAAPLVLGHKGCLKGKRAVCFPGFEAELIGATVESNATGVVCDGKIITARGMGVAQSFGLSLVQALCGAEKAAQLHRAILA